MTENNRLVDVKTRSSIMNNRSKKKIKKINKVQRRTMNLMKAINKAERQAPADNLNQSMKPKLNDEVEHKDPVSKKDKKIGCIDDIYPGDLKEIVDDMNFLLELSDEKKHILCGVPIIIIQEYLIPNCFIEHIKKHSKGSNKRVGVILEYFEGKEPDPRSGFLAPAENTRKRGGMVLTICSLNSNSDLEIFYKYVYVKELASGPNKKKSHKVCELKTVAHDFLQHRICKFEKLQEYGFGTCNLSDFLDRIEEDKKIQHVQSETVFPQTDDWLPARNPISDKKRDHKEKKILIHVSDEKYKRILYLEPICTEKNLDYTPMYPISIVKLNTKIKLPPDVCNIIDGYLFSSNAITCIKNMVSRCKGKIIGALEAQVDTYYFYHGENEDENWTQDTCGTCGCPIGEPRLREDVKTTIISNDDMWMLYILTLEEDDDDNPVINVYSFSEDYSSDQYFKEYYHENDMCGINYELKYSVISYPTSDWHIRHHIGFGTQLETKFKFGTDNLFDMLEHVFMNESPYIKYHRWTTQYIYTPYKKYCELMENIKEES
jgi:hypothetical protein